MSHSVRAIKHVAKVATGKTPSRKLDDNFGGDIPFVTPGDLGLAAYITEAPQTLSQKGAETIKLIPKNAVMVSCIGTLGKVAIAGRELATNQQINSVIFDETKVFPKYGYYALGRLKPKMEALAPSTTVAIINKSNFESLEISVPPLEEQKRIAAILDKADNLRRKRQQAIQLADEFLRAVFLDMFGEMFTTKGYEKASRRKIGELTSYIDYRGKTPEKSESGVPLITAKNVKKGYISEEPREFIPEENYLEWMSRGLPEKNDVLFTTEAPLGNVALLGNYEKVVVGQRLISLRSLGKVTQEFLMHALLNRFVQGLIEKRSSGSTVKGIRTKELYEIEIPVPNLEDQKRFSKIYWKTRDSQERQASSERGAEAVFHSISQKAFSGEL
ncbi:Type I restriction modification DNA specificity domain protein [marine gamma proteobacterium HTCC2148]|nr:Type I restriction modification DNA specificity domain protein [marine gamma proteobacterium HTCC2148]